MRTIAVACALAASLAACVAPAYTGCGKGGRIDRLDWLAGCWKREAGGVLSEEQWTAPAGSMMLGTGRTIRGDETLWFEFLQIRQEGDSVLYTARPSGQEGGVFLLTACTPTMVVFENPAHDFPQRIVYHRIGDDSLHATIEGIQNGSRRIEHFPFRRVSCD